MHHHYYVGHFDPHDRLDKSVRPCRPKVQHPIARATVDHVLASFEPEVADYVQYVPEGYVVCAWSRAPGRHQEDVGRFAYALAVWEDATVMDEGYAIEFPAAARRSQRESAAERLL